MKKYTVALLAILFTAISAVSCSDSKPEPTRAAAGNLDKPEFHTARGDEYLSKGNYADAQNSYERALELAPSDINGKSGKYLAQIYTASEPGNAALVKKDAETALSGLNALKKEAASDAEKARVSIFLIRGYSVAKLSSDWYTRSQSEYDTVKKLGVSAESAEFYMAEADAQKFAVKSAIDRYERVIAVKGVHASEADRKLEKMQKIRRAIPSTTVGRDIAYEDEISRADTAGLLLTRTTLTEKRVQKAIDIQGHVMLDVINSVLNLGIRGLEADASGKFYPDKPITRAEFAVILEDILIRLTSQPQLATKYIGEDSPFPDVSPDKWFYNAARVSVERQFIEIPNKINGEFRPSDPVSGADSLIAVRILKDGLK
ncbi:hypothetical protein CHS0354_026837 [Potamilus streckersoni]|uniref:SLH domain-containing protein n=1 Tax=Potamilus streckersoni TaxID=2493646 RepID=A0AAE0W769_9BIVA|nr:hypothetical protein CHS0354_026837 [Potamilus streckersoni]